MSVIAWRPRRSWWLSLLADIDAKLPRWSLERTPRGHVVRPGRIVRADSAAGEMWSWE